MRRGSDERVEQAPAVGGRRHLVFRADRNKRARGDVRDQRDEIAARQHARGLRIARQFDRGHRARDGSGNLGLGLGAMQEPRGTRGGEGGSTLADHGLQAVGGGFRQWLPGPRAVTERRRDQEQAAVCAADRLLRSCPRPARRASGRARRRGRARAGRAARRARGRSRRPAATPRRAVRIRHIPVHSTRSRVGARRAATSSVRTSRHCCRCRAA